MMTQTSREGRVRWVAGCRERDGRGGCGSLRAVVVGRRWKAVWPGARCPCREVECRFSGEWARREIGVADGVGTAGTADGVRPEGRTSPVVRSNAPRSKTEAVVAVVRPGGIDMVTIVVVVAAAVTAHRVGTIDSGDGTHGRRKLTGRDPARSAVNAAVHARIRPGGRSV